MTYKQKQDLLTEEELWSIVQKAKRKSEDKEELAELVKEALTQMSIEQIIGFDFQFRNLLAKSYKTDLWCVAYVASGGCSDDGFEYFRAWLIGQGKQVYYKALSAPDSLLPALEKVEDYPENEDLMAAAYLAYEAKTGKEDFHEVANQYPEVLTPYQGPDFEWNEEDEESMKRICPRIFKKYWESPFG